MKSFFNKLKKNTGFSLVEVLVAMAVLAVISIPLIRSFVVSANINRNAKRIQNATDIAQDVSEYFTQISLFDLNKKYADDTNFRENYKFDQTNGIVVFQNIGNGTDIDDDGVPYFEGADAEDFYVTVVLDASEYADSATGGIKDINQYISPELGDLFAKDTVTAFSQFTKYDSRIKTALKRKYPELPAVSDMEYSDILKTVEININQEQTSTPSVHYTYSIKVTYTYCNKSGNDYIKTNKSISYTFMVKDDTISSVEQIPDFYILYTPFDVHDDDHKGLAARDEFIINYRKNGVQDDTWEKDVNIYIVQQDVGENCTGLDINKMKINAYSDVETDAVIKYPTMDHLDIFSNVAGWPKNVTQGTSNMVQLFKMDVYVWYGEKDSHSIDDYLKDDFEDTSNFTKITTIKEER